MYCCYAKKSLSESIKCDSPGDNFSSCDDLMKNETLQVFVWVLGLLALIGNLVVILWRIIVKEKNRVQSFLLTNLAVADLLMGVYLLIVAIQDAKWRGKYFNHDILWRSSVLCKVAGMLSMLSSEVSVLTLTAITADRLICIVFPFKFKRLNLKNTSAICIIIWTFGVTISCLPMANINYFYDKQKDVTFFGRSSVCLPLQLSADRPAGYEYSVSIFIGLNFVSFMFILIAYIVMFWFVKKAAAAAHSTNMKKETAMAKRLIFIVMTDFCCWMPVIIIGILSLFDKFYDPGKEVYVWIAVFVLPVNSSINPILYTFSNVNVQTEIKKKCRSMREAIYSRILKKTKGLFCLYSYTYAIQCDEDHDHDGISGDGVDGGDDDDNVDDGDKGNDDGDDEDDGDDDGDDDKVDKGIDDGDDDGGDDYGDNVDDGDKGNDDGDKGNDDGDDNVDDGDKGNDNDNDGGDY